MVGMRLSELLLYLFDDSDTLINYLFGLSDLIITRILWFVVLQLQMKKPGSDDIS